MALAPDAQDGQGPATAIPGWRDDQGQHDPAKATGADGALAAGSQRVAIVPALADTSAPASLQRFVNDEREAAASGIEGLHQQGQQTATAFESGPASTIEHLMVETERTGYRPAPCVAGLPFTVRRPWANKVPMSRRWALRQVGALKRL